MAIVPTKWSIRLKWPATLEDVGHFRTRDNQSLYEPIKAYFMSGQPIASDRFFLFNTILVLTNLVVQSMGLLIGAASPSLEASTFIGPICAIPVLIFAGFFIKKDDMMKAEIQIIKIFSIKNLGVVNFDQVGEGGSGKWLKYNFRSPAWQTLLGQNKRFGSLGKGLAMAHIYILLSICIWISFGCIVWRYWRWTTCSRRMFKVQWKCNNSKSI